LRQISANVGSEASALLRSLNKMTELDVICAKAYLAKEQHAVRPQFVENGGLKIEKGRHPLIDKKNGSAD